jgi:hypothetical protein
MSQSESNPPKKSNPVLLALGLGCGIPLALLILLVFGGIVYLSMGPEGGVRLSNNMEDYALEYIESQDLLEPDETVVAYYDVTVALNGSEAAILTDSRLIYHKSGRNTTMDLANVASIEVTGDGLGGDVIQVVSDTGDTIVIEIAAFNQGDLFADALQRRVDAPATGILNAGSETRFLPWERPNFGCYPTTKPGS